MENKLKTTKSGTGSSTLWKTICRQKYLLLMLLPGLIWFLVFKYCTYAGLGLAFTNYGFKKSVDFVGFRNFVRLFKSAAFWTAFKNTMIISVCNIVFYFPFPIIIALLINELRSQKSKRAVQRHCEPDHTDVGI